VFKKVVEAGAKKGWKEPENGPRQKNWRSDGRQFAHVVGNTDQAPLGEQVFRGLSAVYPEFEADLYAAIALGLRALGFERAVLGIVG